MRRRTRGLDGLRALEDRIRPDFRRTVVYGVVALTAVAVGHELKDAHPTMDAGRLAAYACAVLVLVFGVAATRSAAREVVRVASHRAGVGTTTPLRLLIQVTGYVLTLIAVLTVLEIDISQFLVGGALTGVVIGIAAQQVLGNFFAGMVLQVARPYNLGDYVRVHSGAIGGPHEGTVTDVSLLYTTLLTEAGPLNVPNGQLLGSALAPHAKPLPPEEPTP